jgi:hypothetical protein
MALKLNDLVEVSLLLPDLGRVQAYPARVKEVNGQAITLTILPPHQLPVEVGSAVIIKKMEPERVFIFEAVAKTIQAKPFTLTGIITKTYEQEQRRGSRRFTISVDTRYRQEADEAGWLSAMVWDLSEAGICLIGAKMHEPGDRLLIDLPLQPTVCVAGVVRVCTVHNPEANTFALGIQFANLTQNEQEAVFQFLVSHQIKKVRDTGSSLFNYIPRKPIRVVRGPRP